jgi:hypothetical protein
MINNKKIVELVWQSYDTDILDARFHELQDIIDQWIIVEYPYDFARIKRPLYFSNERERFKKFEDKIIHVIDDHDYNGADSLTLLWSRKQSPKIRNILNETVNQDDFLVISDSDCFLTKHCFENTFDPEKIYSFCLPWFLWWFDMRTFGPIFNWTQSAPYKYFDHCLMAQANGVEVNYVGDGQLEGKQAGYHFAKCGTPEMISEHLKGHPHQDLVQDPSITNIEHIKERMEKGYGWTDVSMGKAGKDWKWEFIDYDTNFYPEYINQHPEIYSKYFHNRMKLKKEENE